MKNTLFLLVIFAILGSLNANAQQFYRIKTDFSIKYKDANGKQLLQMGAIFYDINNKTIVIKTGFPTKQTIAQKDSIIYKIGNSEITKQGKVIIPVELSIFHLALTGNLENFGLDKLAYHIEEIKNEKGLVISIWTPNEKIKKYAGKILVATKNKQLHSIIFLDKNQKITTKHFYRNYTNINGMMFPCEVLRINYDGDKESYKLSTYKNIILNETNKNEEYYTFN